MDEALRNSHRIYENLSHLRTAVIAQQNAVSERARTQGINLDDEFQVHPDEYRAAGLGERDLQKRRGVSMQ